MGKIRQGSSGRTVLRLYTTEPAMLHLGLGQQTDQEAMTGKILGIGLVIAVAGLIACSEPPVDSDVDQAEDSESMPAADSQPVADNRADGNSLSNPLLRNSDLDLGFPHFDQIRTADYLPAFELGMAEQRAEVEAIASQTAEPDFVNTIVALELSGQLLNRVQAIFSNLSRAHSDDEMRVLQQQLTPLLAAHDDSIVHNAALFARIADLYQARAELQLDPESDWLLQRYYRDFQRAGAMLDENQKSELRSINSELALLQARVSQNILKEANRLAIVVQDAEDLAGLSEAELGAAANAARADNLESGYLLALQNATQQPLLSKLENRALREYIMSVSLSRGSNGGEFDNRELLSRILTLRSRKARMLGFDNYAAYILDNQTAGSVAAVDERMQQLVSPAVANVRAEAQELQALLSQQNPDYSLASWDWEYLRAQLSRQENAFDTQVLRPYFELNNVLINGLFYAAEQLYGIHFKERFDLPVYQDDVRVFEVFDASGATLALFIGDYFQRPSKRGGAWNSIYVAQNGLLGEQPVVANHLNIPKPVAGEPALLTLDEVHTLFHEFGHALHNFFSDVQYPYFSGSRVPRDFVEFPSQVNEMWASWPEVLKHYAFHYQTGAPMPQSLQEKISESGVALNQAYATTEYLGAAILDMAMHELDEDKVPAADELLEFEDRVLANANIDTHLVPPRYRSTYFNHIMGGYAAGYYSYIWAEVLDADTVEWFKENGGLTRENGSHFRRTLLSRGGSADAMQLFRNFRGRDASLQPLLERRGLLPAPGQ